MRCIFIYNKKHYHLKNQAHYFSYSFHYKWYIYNDFEGGGGGYTKDTGAC